MFFASHFKKGLISSITVMIVSAVGLLIGTTALLSALSETQLEFRHALSRQTFFGAEACLEQALMNRHQDQNYIGGSFGFQTVSCTVTVTNPASNQSQIQVVATHPQGYTRNLETTVEWGSEPRLIFWAETVQ